MAGDQDRGAQPVQRLEQAQQLFGHHAVHAAGRFVGDDQAGAGDDGAGDGQSLFLAAGQGGRQGVHAVAQAHPLQHLGHIGGIGRLALMRQPQRQGCVFKG